MSYRDVGYIGPLLTSLLLYISPVAYSAESVPEEFEKIYQLNPLAGLLDAWRWAVFGSTPVSGTAVLYGVVVSIVVFTIGTMLFTRMEPRFPDVI